MTRRAALPIYSACYYQGGWKDWVGRGVEKEKGERVHLYKERIGIGVEEEGEEEEERNSDGKTTEDGERETTSLQITSILSITSRLISPSLSFFLRTPPPPFP